MALASGHPIPAGLLLVAVSMSGCALLYDYSGYKDGGTGAGHPTTSSSAVTATGATTGSSSSGCSGTCPGEDTACQKVTCDNGVCGFVYEPKGTMFDIAIGDCQKEACDGSGGFTEVADDTDTPSTGNACTIGTCAGGKPGIPKPAPAGTACGSGLSCDATGSCSGCTMTSQCPTSSTCATFTCNAPQCTPQYHDGLACGAGPSCTAGLAKVQDACLGAMCIAGATTSCGAYACGATGCRSTCAGDGDCSAASYCAAPACAPKKPDGSLCGGASECSTGTCTAQSNCCKATCGGSGSCVPANEGASCGAASCANAHQLAAHQCSGGACATNPSTDCTPYACSNGSCNGSCATSANCAAGYHCWSNATCCVPCTSFMFNNVGAAAELCPSGVTSNLIGCLCSPSNCQAACANTLCLPTAMRPDGACTNCMNQGSCGLPMVTNNYYGQCQLEVP